MILQGSWKTTSSGITMIAGALVHLWFTRDAITEGSIMTALGLMLGGIGLMFARDNNKSSEDVGLKSDNTTPTKGQ